MQIESRPSRISRWPCAQHSLAEFVLQSACCKYPTFILNSISCESWWLPADWITLSSNARRVTPSRLIRASRYIECVAQELRSILESIARCSITRSQYTVHFTLRALRNCYAIRALPSCSSEATLDDSLIDKSYLTRFRNIYT